MNTKTIMGMILILLASGRVGAGAVDLSNVPQLHETKEQRDAACSGSATQSSACSSIGAPAPSARKRSAGAATPTGRGISTAFRPRARKTPCTTTTTSSSTPKKYNADEWVRFAKESGMKYMVLIAKHHDGFAQFDSKVCDYNIMASPYGKDIVRAYADACHKQGMKLGLYYSTPRLAPPRLPRRRQQEIRRFLPRPGQGTALQLRDGGRDVVRSCRRTGLGQVEVRRALLDALSTSAKADRQ